MELAKVLLLVCLTVLSVSGWDSVMDERFSVYYHTLNTNGDDIVSLDDLATCANRSTEKEENVRVKVKCEEMLPRWFIYCIMGGYDGLSEPEFIRKFQDIEAKKGRDKFAQTLFRCAQVGYRIMDINGDGFISYDEDTCMATPTRPVDAARALVTYLMNDTPSDFIPQNAACPWISVTSESK